MKTLIFLSVAIPIALLIVACNRALTEQFQRSADAYDS